MPYITANSPEPIASPQTAPNRPRVSASNRTGDDTRFQRRYRHIQHRECSREDRVESGRDGEGDGVRRDRQPRTDRFEQDGDDAECPRPSAPRVSAKEWRRARRRPHRRRRVSPQTAPNRSLPTPRRYRRPSHSAPRVFPRGSRQKRKRRRRRRTPRQTAPNRSLRRRRRYQCPRPSAPRVSAKEWRRARRRPHRRRRVSPQTAPNPIASNAATIPETVTFSTASVPERIASRTATIPVPTAFGTASISERMASSPA